ncbi:MAG TPA: HEAT repeat domain-containing protein [Kofleriaceae bacterium]|nr:HEAT repeat domain-containing protein [Kofleriaceae bacterium]
MTPMKKWLPLALAAAALLGAGVWLGRSSTAPSAAPAPSGGEPIAGRGRPSAQAPRLAARTAGGAPAAARRSAAAVDPGLQADLSDADPKVRRAAVRELAADRDADPALLLAASRDPDLEVGVTATEALGKLHAQGEVPVQELIARATDRKLDERVRVSALNGLGLVPSPESAALLTELAVRGDAGERRTAAILLVHQELAAAVPALLGLLGDADEYVRSNALESLRARSRGRDFGTDAAAWRAWWAARSR